MFGKAKGSSHEKDEPLPPAPQLQELASANLGKSDLTKISCIGPGMIVAGKISGEGLLNVLGRVEGEVHASIVRILTAPKWKAPSPHRNNYRRPF